MGTLDGKVAFITGAARAQGRSHAVRLAREGADIIAIDICRQLDSVPYAMGTEEELAETVARVEALDRRIVSAVADVRDAKGLRDALADGLGQLGGVDIVLANAGIFNLTDDPAPDDDARFAEVVDINLTGVWNTVKAAAPTMIEQGRGGSIVLTSSTMGLTGRAGDGSGGLTGYQASKHGLVGLMRSFAHWLAPHHIRVNTVHPTAVNNSMSVNETLGRIFEAHPEKLAAVQNLMPVDLIEEIDISNAIAWLVSDAARFVTGVMLPVDAGFAIR